MLVREWHMDLIILYLYDYITKLCRTQSSKCICSWIQIRTVRPAAVQVTNLRFRVVTEVKTLPAVQTTIVYIACVT
jgi:hypothetical protein